MYYDCGMTFAGKCYICGYGLKVRLRDVKQYACGYHISKLNIDVISLLNKKQITQILVYINPIFIWLCCPFSSKTTVFPTSVFKLAEQFLFVQNHDLTYSEYLKLLCIIHSLPRFVTVISKFIVLNVRTIANVRP